MDESQAQQLINNLTQSSNGMNRLVAMTGAKNIIFSSEDNYVSFKLPKISKYNYVKIVLNPMDTYDVYFEKHIWSKMKMMKQVVVSGLYNEMLKSTFEQNTGLHLSL